MTKFKNNQFLDFSDKKVREDFQNNLDAINQQISKTPWEVTPIINGKKITTNNVYERVDTNHPSQILSKNHFYNPEEVNSVIDNLAKARTGWSARPIKERADILRRAAQIMRERQAELCCIIARESAKNWLESDKDVVEGIDFLDYYAEEAESCLKEFTTQNITGETNKYTYQSMGVAAVIAPWNFPLAIPTGMIAAPLVAGNTVIFKPAEQSSYIGQIVVEIFLEAGLPPETLAFIPGQGEEVGPEIITHPQVPIICLTGSLAVGKFIRRTVATLDNIKRFKRCILELGGKNAIIVDADADLDEAIKGVIYSAFAYAGQKCSACSRLILHESIEAEFIKRFLPAVESLIAGFSYQSEAFLTPVIDEEAHKRILETIETAKKSNDFLLQTETPAEGHFIPATIFKIKDTNDPLWLNEIFGPVLAINTCTDINDALNQVNQSHTALTGGLYSRSPENIDLVSQKIEVGNFYINRACTGAVVGRQPFGGFKLSGVGSKAGGPDYLKQFVVPKVISENISRKGIA